jgi:cyclophilin family peptidyl-prolyl cis-trans isomerase
MASLEFMPHTVNQFLKQVHTGLWDGTSLAMNAQHVMQFGPQYTGDADTTNIEDGSSSSSTKKRYQDFYNRGIDKLSFQEYSPQYPHTQWTLGLAGRPSGPDFYINKIDNTIRHGPGGQMHTGEMHNEADPCFAKLIDGTRPFISIIDAINKVPVDRYDKYPITIVSAMILIPKLDGSGWRAINKGEKWDENDKIMPL